jgi:hypothetical protein
MRGARWVFLTLLMFTVVFGLSPWSSEGRELESRESP